MKNFFKKLFKILGMLVLLFIVIAIVGTFLYDRAEKESENNLKTEKTVEVKEEPKEIKKEYWENGNLKFEYETKDGELNGFFNFYDEKGYFRTSIYNLQMVNKGLATAKWDDKEYEIEIKNGKPDGLLKVYDKDGNLIEETEYVEGLENGMSRHYYSDGNLSMEYSFKNGKEEGLCKSYNPDGSISLKMKYKNGMPIAGKSYYSDGRVGTEVYSEHGNSITKHYDPVTGFLFLESYTNLETGEIILNRVYDADGILEKESRYENGKLKEEIKF